MNSVCNSVNDIIKIERELLYGIKSKNLKNENIS
jgi:hypothetical protein